MRRVFFIKLKTTWKLHDVRQKRMVKKCFCSLFQDLGWSPVRRAWCGKLTLFKNYQWRIFFLLCFCVHFQCRFYCNVFLFISFYISYLLFNYLWTVKYLWVVFTRYRAFCKCLLLLLNKFLPFLQVSYPGHQWESRQYWERGMVSFPRLTQRGVSRRENIDITWRSYVFDNTSFSKLNPWKFLDAMKSKWRWPIVK